MEQVILIDHTNTMKVSLLEFRGSYYFVVPDNELFRLSLAKQQIAVIKDNTTIILRVIEVIDNPSRVNHIVMHLNEFGDVSYHPDEPSLIAVKTIIEN